MNTFKKKLLFAILILFVVSSSILRADDFQYMTEELPPYSFKDEKGLPAGINVDILLEMFKELGNGKTRKDIQILPWVRGMKLVKEKGKKNLLFSTTRTPERESLFKWAGPLGISTSEIIVLRGNPQKVSLVNDSDFHNYRFGAIRDDLGDEYLKNKNVDQSKISYSTNILTIIKKLQSKRIDAISYDIITTLWLIQQNGLNPNDFESIESVEFGQYYFAFNLSVDDTVVESHQNALDKVKANVKLMEQIKDRYLNN